LAREGTEIKSTTISGQIDEQESHENESSGPPLKKRKLGGSWLKAAMKEQESTSTKSREELIMNEIEHYCIITKSDADSNHLDWWKVHGFSYPTLAKLAKKYLICVSSCASERLFSTSDHMASKKRNLLKPNKLNVLVFLARNLQ